MRNSAVLVYASFYISMENKIITAGSKNSSNTEKMDHQKVELMAKLRCVREENQKLTSMVKVMFSNYENLQSEFTRQQEERLISSRRSMAKTLKLGLDVAGDADHGECRPKAVDNSADSRSSLSQNSEEKNSKPLMLPCKKRKINYACDQTANETEDSSTDGDLTNKKAHDHLLNKDSIFPAHVCASKKIVTQRTKLDATKVNDGCQWRKYGQKMTRNSPWPRGYYRCAMSPSCSVKKQVQRSAEDPSVVTTTYEGEHNHMLSPLAMTTMNAGSDNHYISKRNPSLIPSNQLPFPASIATVSSMGSSPTIVLDLTGNPIPSLNPNSNPGRHSMHPQFAQASQLYYSNLLGQPSDPQDYNQLGQGPVGSMEAYPNLTASLALAVAGSVLKLTPSTAVHKAPDPAMQYTFG